MHFKVLYEDNHLIAINKPAGYLVQGDQTGDTPLSEMVKSYIKIQYDKPGAVFLGVIHRLDRPVSGVLLFARTSKALTRMNKLFQERKIEKKYWAITADQPNPITGTLVHYIAKDKNKNRAHVYDEHSRRASSAKRAELSYEMVSRIGSHFLSEVSLKTGRPHQIRGQFAKNGTSIRGDVKYGAKHANDDGSIHLHCRSLSFIHPVKKEPVTIVAGVPKEDEIWRLFAEQ